VIAPIPDKSQGLKHAFIQKSFAAALSFVRRAGVLIALGYSFHPYDCASYNLILKTLVQTKERTLFIVSPQAEELAKQILAEYTGLKVHPIEKTFKAWAMDSFRGI